MVSHCICHVLFISNLWVTKTAPKWCSFINNSRVMQNLCQHYGNWLEWVLCRPFVRRFTFGLSCTVSSSFGTFCVPMAAAQLVHRRCRSARISARAFIGPRQVSCLQLVHRVVSFARHLCQSPLCLACALSEWHILRITYVSSMKS